MADAAGPRAARRGAAAIPARTTTRGVGELMAAAIDAGARRLARVPRRERHERRWGRDGGRPRRPLPRRWRAGCRRRRGARSSASRGSTWPDSTRGSGRGGRTGCVRRGQPAHRPDTARARSTGRRRAPRRTTWPCSTGRWGTWRRWSPATSGSTLSDEPGAGAAGGLGFGLMAFCGRPAPPGRRGRGGGRRVWRTRIARVRPGGDGRGGVRRAVAPREGRGRACCAAAEVAGRAAPWSVAGSRHRTSTGRRRCVSLVDEVGEEAALAGHPPRPRAASPSGARRRGSRGRRHERRDRAVRRCGHAPSASRPRVHRFPEGTKTAEDAARAIGCDVAQIVKSLVFVADDQAGARADLGPNRVDPAKLWRPLPARRGAAGHPEEARAATGFAVGGTPPFGHPTRLRTFIDPDLLAPRRGLGRRGHAGHRLRDRPRAPRARSPGRRSPTSPEPDLEGRVHPDAAGTLALRSSPRRSTGGPMLTLTRPPPAR